MQGSRGARFWFLAALSLTPLALTAAPELKSSKTIIYFFRAEGCPHCAEAELFLTSLAARSPSLELRSLEVTRHKENARAYIRFAHNFGFKARSVPAIFAGNRYWVGYTPEIGGQIAEYLEVCHIQPCIDAALYVLPQKTARPEEPGSKQLHHAHDDASPVYLEVPVFGRVDLSHGSLWANTALIAFADGFNPCSLWVLSMLLALIIHTGSRGKVFIIGFLFLTVSSLVYVAFIAGIFSIMQLVGLISGVRIAMAALTLVMGIINIKDYFWFGKGISLTIAAEKKPGIFARMRDILAASNAFWPMFTATVLLAAGVSLAEFSCTAGFPVLWANLVSAQNISTGDFVLLLVFYMLIYQLDEMIIFITVVITLRIGRFEEKQGRALKLFGGVLMCTLAGVLIIKPELLDDIFSSVMVFLSACAGSLIISLITHTIRRVNLNGSQSGSS